MTTNGNGRKKKNGNGNGRVKPTRPPPGARLTTTARSDLHDAGLSLFPFFETMINPEDSPPMRVPDAHAGRTAVFKTPFVVDLPYSGVWNADTNTSGDIDEKEPVDGSSEVILIPGSVDCIMYTLGADVITIFDAEDSGAMLLSLPMLVPIMATHPLMSDHIDIGLGSTACVQGLRLTGLGVPQIALLPKFSTEGRAVFECDIVPDPADVLNFAFRLGFANRGALAPQQTEAILTLHYGDGTNVSVGHRVTSGGGQELPWNVAAGTSEQVGFTPYNIAATGHASAIGFSVSVTDTDPASHWVFSIPGSCSDGAEISIRTRTRSACAFTVQNAPEMDTLAETLSERTSALSGLLTYMGSTLQDGGQIAAARLGMGLSPLRAPRGDSYKYLASLPFYNDDYPLREGAYSWWLPDSIQEHFYVPYRRPRSDDLEENAVLQFALLRDAPTQAVRLKVVQNLEVITRSRLYTSESGPVNPSYASLIGAIKLIPAVSGNPRHRSILSKALGFVRNWVANPQNWRKLVRGGAELISKASPGSIIGKVASVMTSV